MNAPWPAAECHLCGNDDAMQCWSYPCAALFHLLNERRWLHVNHWLLTVGAPFRVVPNPIASRTSKRGWMTQESP
jgi:hypothetical protein